MHRRRITSVCIVAAALAFTQIPSYRDREVRAASGSVSGVVFEDKTSDGAKGTGDPGLSGVGVTAYDATGAAVGSATTGSDGSYTLTVSSADTTAVRIEFATPGGYSPSFVGADNKSSIQFVSLGATNVSYGVHKPGEYCTNLFAAGIQGDQLGSTCFQPSNAQDRNTVNTSEWASRMGTVGTATAAQTGSVWGLGYDGVRGLLWTSAVIRRHSPVGPQKLCGIYVSNPATNTLVTSFDLKQAPYALDCGDDSNFDASQAIDRDLVDSSEQAWDLPAFPLIGKAAFGDLDVSPDGQYLFVVNLHDKKVYRFTIGGTTASPTLTAAGSWSVNNLCVTGGSVIRPWALEPIDGSNVYVGSVCSNESTTATATAAPESATVQKLAIAGDGTGTWSTTTTVNLGYVRACFQLTCGNEQKGDLSKWKAWSNDYAAIKALQPSQSTLIYPQPILSDIDFLDDGSMVLGLIDRFSLQMGYNNLSPDATKTNLSLVSVFVHGDLLLFCKNGATFEQESDGSCTGKSTTTHNGALDNGTSPNKEFFDDNFWDGASLHPELSQGGIAVKRDSGELAFTAMDPRDWIEQGGIRYLKQSDGKRSTWPYYTVITQGAGGEGNGTRKHFSKSASMGDLEVLCDSAPVQIGDRVWLDTDGDGIQDPGESGIANVYIKLKRVSDNLIWGTVKTDANGNFRFSSNYVDPWNDTSDAIGGGLVANEAFYLEVSDDYVGNNFGAGGTLVGYSLTSATQTSPTSPNDTSIDSNATVTSAAVWRAQVPALSPGSNNHTYDIGVTGSVSVGNKVFIDANSDGIQDAGESGLAGATLTLTDMNGSSVTDINQQLVQPITTGGTGAYLFENLPIGQYKVNITYPAGYGPTLTGQGTAATDSSSYTATSSAFSAPGQSDLTLDFGVIVGGTTTTSSTTTTTSAPPSTAPAGSATTSTTSPAVPVRVSVGDYVWFDTNRDGIQDSTDIPLAGVTLTIATAEGGPVRDVSGNVVTTTVTDGSGKYTFDNLPLGRYRVTVTAPAGFRPTRAGVGASATDSSTGFALSVNLNVDGQRDPTLDFGFIASSRNTALRMMQHASLGDQIWIDENGDGIQEDTPRGLAGATVLVRNLDGTRVRDVSGRLVGPQVTEADGKYLFRGLPAGRRYVVHVKYPKGVRPTTPGRLGRGINSSSGKATSRLLKAGAMDLSLDFGVVSHHRDELPNTR